MKKTVRLSIPVSRENRRLLAYADTRYDKRGRLLLSGPRDARDLAARLGRIQGGPPPSAADIYGAAWIITAWRLMLNHFSEGSDPFEPGAVKALGKALGEDGRDAVLTAAAAANPDDAVWHGRRTPRESALRKAQRHNGNRRLSGSERTVRNWSLSRLASADPAFTSFASLFADPAFDEDTRTLKAAGILEEHDGSRPARDPEDAPPLATLRRPVEAAPDSVKDQLLYILTRWNTVLGDWTPGLVGALDMIEEETRPRFGGGPGPAMRPGFEDLDGVARFSDDVDWMPRVVLVAKNILVWLDQLSKSYGRTISTLDGVPDEELDIMASRGFNALWLIGLWERSSASREIKQRMGNPEAAASAYSLFGYEIDPALGGWEALDNLRGRAERRGIRLSSDMVPNHVGIDSDWVRHYPDRLLSVDECPYPTYGFGSEDLSGDGRVDIRLEDHYWEKSDAAVVFRRMDKDSGRTQYIYHGNDGTSMPWNDTAQIDFLNPEAREAVIRDILHVARNFPIIRFDAAMVLARKSIRRLWFPPPGSGGAIPSRSEHALTDEEFNEACPAEFWREVVDRVAVEVPGTLLLAEAFWMMEGYFVRVLGMHRVYNSAFMNMLRDQKNDEYRALIKETLAFDPGILQRFVNFMNNPDEETAVEQFGKDDRYFATATLLATLPGLPMFGHGQVEGLSEKYGMEYVRAYRDEDPDAELIARHVRELFPLIHRRNLFAGALSFRLYDLNTSVGVNENVFAYSNYDGLGRALVLVNNCFERAEGNLNHATPVKTAEDEVVNESLADALVPGDLADDDWVMLREDLSGLWFLRSAGSLRHGGLSVSIDGFGRQLYIDYRYETETRDGIWGRLAAELAGAGTPDPDAAATELRLRPVRQALDAILSKDGLETLAAQLHRGRKPDWPVKEAEIAELIRLHKGITGGGQNADSRVLDSQIRHRLAAAAGHRRFPASSLRRTLDRRFPGHEGRSTATLLALHSVVGTLTELDGPSGTTAVREAWGLSRWLEITGIDTVTENAEQNMKAVASGREAVLKGGRPLKILSTLMASPAFREACGVNTWDGVIWFGRDEWKCSIRAAVLTAGYEDLPLLKRMRLRRNLRRSLRVWARATAVSGYKLDALLNAAR